MITEALTADDRVLEVGIDSMGITSRNSMAVKGWCNTVYGSVPIENEVTLNNESE